MIPKPSKDEINTKKIIGDKRYDIKDSLSTQSMAYKTIESYLRGVNTATVLVLPVSSLLWPVLHRTRRSYCWKCKGSASQGLMIVSNCLDERVLQGVSIGPDFFLVLNNIILVSSRYCDLIVSARIYWSAMPRDFWNLGPFILHNKFNWAALRQRAMFCLPCISCLPKCAVV